jgi:hypothetical protein
MLLSVGSVASQAGSVVGGVLSDVFGGGPPYAKSLDRQKNLFRAAVNGDTAAIEHFRQNSAQCGSKYEHVCRFMRAAWLALDFRAKTGKPIILRSTGWPDLQRMGIAQGVADLTIPEEPTIGQGVEHFGDPDTFGTVSPATQASSSPVRGSVVMALALAGFAFWLLRETRR